MKSIIESKNLILDHQVGPRSKYFTIDKSHRITDSSRRKTNLLLGYAQWTKTQAKFKVTESERMLLLLTLYLSFRIISVKQDDEDLL